MTDSYSLASSEDLQDCSLCEYVGPNWRRCHECGDVYCLDCLWSPAPRMFFCKNCAFCSCGREAFSLCENCDALVCPDCVFEHPSTDPSYCETESLCRECAPCA